MKVCTTESIVNKPEVVYAQLIPLGRNDVKSHKNKIKNKARPFLNQQNWSIVYNTIEIRSGWTTGLVDDIQKISIDWSRHEISTSADQ